MGTLVPHQIENQGACAWLLCPESKRVIPTGVGQSMYQVP